MIEELKQKMEADGLNVHNVAVAIGVKWDTVKAWLDGTKKPRGLSKKAIRQFLEG